LKLVQIQDKAEKEKNKATDDYEKAVSRISPRMLPLGYDRYYSSWFYFPSDPKRVFVENPKREWQAIDKRSTFDAFVGSLDVRGRREKTLAETFEDMKIRKRLRNDYKEIAAARAAEKSKEDLFKKLREAEEALAIEEEGSSRRSGRLAGIVQSELVTTVEKLRNQAELEKSIQTQLLIPPDWREVTGIEKLVEFEKDHAQYLKNMGVKDVEYQMASRVWEEGPFVLIINKMLEVQVLYEDLIPADEHSSWKKKLENTMDLWAENCTSLLGPQSPEVKQVNRENDSGKLSVIKLLDMIRKPLIELEERVSRISGIGGLSQFIQEANKNFNEEEEEQKRAILRWKRQIHLLYSTVTMRSTSVREILIRAIALARKSGQKSATAELQDALKLLRPNSAGPTKVEALAVLERHGGYDPMEDGEDDDDVEGSAMNDDDIIDLTKSASSSEVQSKLTTEALVFNASLSSDTELGSEQWRRAVRQCKTLATLSALFYTFSKSATNLLKALKKERNTFEKAMLIWEAESAFSTSRRKKKQGGSRFNVSSKIWVNCVTTTEFVWVKRRSFPWWPAQICELHDSDLARTLKKCGRSVIRFVGETYTHVAMHGSEIRSPFNLSDAEDLTKYNDDTTTKFKECMDMVRRYCHNKDIDVEGDNESKN